MQKVLILFGIMLFPFFSCRLPGNTEASIISITGELNTQTSRQSFMTKRSLIADATDIVAYPVIANPDRITVTNQVEETIDGTEFNLDVNKDDNYIFVLINKNASNIYDRFVGFVTMQTNDTDTLTCIPIENAKVDAIDLGFISQTDEEAVSENSAAQTASYFDLTEEELIFMARHDDIYKNAKNKFINYDPENTTWYITLNFWWRGVLSDTISTFSLPESIQYEGYNISFEEFGAVELSMDEIIEGRKVEIVPPAEVTNGSEIWSPTQPFRSYDNPGGETVVTSADGVRWFDDREDFTACDASSPIASVHIQLPDDFVGPPLSGYWKLIVDETELLAAADMSIGSPFDDDGNPDIFIPSISLTLENGIFARMETQWYRYDKEQDDYTLITNYERMKQLIGFAGMGLNEQDTNYSEGIDNAQDYDFVIRAEDLDSTWVYPGSSESGRTINSVSFAYLIFGVGFNFFFNIGTN